MKWVFGVNSVAEMLEKGRDFDLEGVLEDMQCPYLVVHGGYDVLGVDQATRVHDYAREHGVDVTLRLLSADETGAEHCQHDNPSLGMEIVADWLAARFGIDQRALRRS